MRGDENGELKESFPSVLITGTTSGIGKGLLQHYTDLGRRVIGVNRSDDTELRRLYPKADLVRIDITQYEQVYALLERLNRQDKVPNTIILNAGINKPDNLSTQFDYASFREVMEINLMGVITFTAASRNLGFRSITFVGISSVSNIIPNPGHVGYALSKLGIQKAFELFQKQDSFNRYKSVVLGPVRTNIMRDYAGPTGWQRKLFEALAVDTEDAVHAIARFSETGRTVLNYPVPACLFYQCARVVLKMTPWMYRGTRQLPSERQESLKNASL